MNHQMKRALNERCIHLYCANEQGIFTTEEKSSSAGDDYDIFRTNFNMFCASFIMNDSFHF